MASEFLVRTGTGSVQTTGGVNTTPVPKRQEAQKTPSSAQASPADRAQEALRQSHSPDGKTAQLAAATEEQVSEAVEQMNEFVQSMQRELHFSVDKESGETIIKVVDSESGETIRQLPPEELVELARRLEKAGNLLVNEKA